MLVIRKDQMLALSAESERQYDTRLAEYLTAEYPAQVERMGAEGLRSLIDRAKAGGREFRIEGAGAMAVWTELWLLFGDGLRRSPDRMWAERILRHDSLPDYIRVDQVRERLTSRTGGRAVVVANDGARD